MDNSLVNFEKLEKIFYRVEVEAWTVFSDAIPCLEWAQKAGFKLGLVSNARSDWAVREVLNRLRLNKHFKVAVTSAQVGWRKPRPEPFLEALKYFEEKPQHAAFIGDTFSTDIVGAKRLGMKTIYLNRNGNPIPSIEDIVPDFTIKDFLEAVKVAKNLMDH